MVEPVCRTADRSRRQDLYAGKHADESIADTELKKIFDRQFIQDRGHIRICYGFGLGIFGADCAE